MERFAGGEMNPWLAWRAYGEAARAYARMAPVLVVCETGSTPGGVTVIRHGLGRVPRGMRIVNSSLPAGTGQACGWWREAGDADWGPVELTARFDVAGGTLLVEVF